MHVYDSIIAILLYFDDMIDIKKLNINLVMYCNVENTSLP